MEKKGLSQIVGTVVLIMITVALVAGIWGVTNTFVTKRLGDAEACYGIFDKVTLNNEYTCFNVTSNTTLVSINLQDIDLDAIYISVNYETENDVYILTNESQVISGILPYNSGLTEVLMPPKEAGRTYVIEREDRPTKIELAPKSKGKVCDVSDFLDNVPTCL
ncbi:hypothetical protein GW931_00500 [archaeon]|nr:hypothetical protein [archaeon]